MVRSKSPKIIAKAKTKQMVEIDGLKYRVSVEGVLMLAGNAEVTVKFKPLESAPPIILVIRAIKQALVG